MYRYSRQGKGPRAHAALALALAICLPLLAANAMGQTTKTSLKSLIDRRAASTTGNLKASFAYSPKYPATGQNVQFVDSSTGNPKSWQWDFGDGTTSADQNPVHVYGESGFKTVTLVVSNGTASKKASHRVPVFTAKASSTSTASTLSASFTYEPKFPVAGQSVQFTDATTGSPSSWLWAFGDETTSSGQNPSHVYNAAGSYNVSLTVANASESKNINKTITVDPQANLKASFTYSPTTLSPGQVVQFTDASSGNPTSWQWNFGDGSEDETQNPAHVYAAAGSYAVTLTITAGASSANTSTNITVGQASGVVTAASPSYEDVTAAISKAQSGDTVMVPAGSATWTSPLVITNGLKLVGAGIGQTVITSGYSGQATYTNYTTPTSHLITYYPESPERDEPFRLSGFTFDFNANCYGPYLYNPSVKPITKVRIDHCELKNSYSGGMELIMVDGTVYGCIDNNILSGGTFMFRSFGVNDATWNNLTFEYGTASNIYFEDNVINCNDSVIEGGAAGRYAFRYNVLNLSANAFPVWDAHGNQPRANNATMGVEIYENTINWGSYNGKLFDHRGGMALVYNNYVNTTSWVIGQTREEYIDSCLPPAVNPLSGQPQYISQSYYWNNLKNGTTLIDVEIPPGLYPDGGQVDYAAGQTAGGVSYPPMAPYRIVPQWNLDCWKQVAAFDGTSGVGAGLLAGRPATGTAGVGYWATDTRTLYRWTAGKWEEYYKPYTYPHPLRSQD